MRNVLERWLHSIWYDDAASGWFLLPLSWLYGLLVRIRKLAYQNNWRSSYRATIPVAVVGNLTAGGVGKTPFVIWLVKWLQQEGYSPGVVTRGYGGSLKSTTLVNDEHDARQIGDEALMLARRLEVPIVVGARRSHSAALLEGLPVNVIVADDGLQHYALDRDVEICVVDAQRQFGNQKLIPAGPLRESIARLQEVALVIQHRRALKDEPLSMALGNARLINLLDNTARELESFAGTPVHAIAGVGNPERFFASLTTAGIQVHAHPFADHHVFTRSDLEFGDDLPVLMTDKDAVKCQAFATRQHFVVRVDALVSQDVEATIRDVFATLPKLELS